MHQWETVDAGYKQEYEKLACALSGDPVYLTTRKHVNYCPVCGLRLSTEE